MCKLRHLRQAFPEVISLTVILVLAGAMVLPVALLFRARPVLAAAPVVSIQRVSLSSRGSEGNGDCGYWASISADGRYVAFQSLASNLVLNDTNDVDDIFVHDRQTGETARVSLSSGGTEGNGGSGKPSISADGRYVAFTSDAAKLVPGDTNGVVDVFVHDRQTGETARVSLSSGGTEGNGNSYIVGISADGRYVAFWSEDATNLVPDDTNAASDIFVHDRQTGETARVSLSSGGSEGNGHCWDASISADGRYVAFHSLASNLVPDDTNGESDVFVHDRQTGETARVSLSSGGTEGNSSSGSPSISADGRYVAFVSLATNLVPGDNKFWDTFVHDRQTGQTTRVSMSSGGKKGNGGSGNPSISADGRYVAFNSDATNLVPGDTNGVVDVFVHDRQTGQTVRVSLSWDGSEGNDASCNPSISADGRYVAFWSDATNLVPDDTNGFPDIFVQDWAEVAVAASAGGLPGGVIAGIVIGAVAVVGALAFFWFRRPKNIPPVS